MRTFNAISMTPAYQPAHAELQMLAAITASTARDAITEGEQRLRFRNFKIAVRCLARVPGTSPLVELTIDSGDEPLVALREPVNMVGDNA
jgi:hypothetical protein